MKQNIKRYFIVLVITGCTFSTGCDEFLTTIPESSYSAAGSYKSQADFNFAIAAVYAQQQSLYQSNSCWFRLMIARSDDTKSGAVYTTGLDTFTDNDQCTELNGGWSGMWSMITRSNMILDRIDAIEFDDNNLKNWIKGEALSLRAWCFHWLGCLYGGMPLIDREMSVDEIRALPRSSQAETFAMAENDFKSAIGLLPDSWSGANTGRITKYAAEGVLARLLMFQGKFSEAKPYLADIINSGLYGMEEEYVNCFADGSDNGKERVWEIQFAGNMSGEGQRFSTGMLPEGVVTPAISPISGYSSALRVSLDLMDAWEDGDIRKEVSTVGNLTINGVLEGTYSYIRKWVNYTYSPKNADDYAINLPVLRYTDVRMMYAECLNEEGYQDNGEAFIILNDVRARAGLTALTSAELPNQAAFRNALIKERRVEFAFEGLRWLDLVRWGIAKQTMNAYFAAEDEGSGRYSYGDGDFRNIFAIPAVEMDRYNNETVMWQNPGY